MTRAFADTSYFVARLDRRDSLNERAKAAGRGRRLVTTEYVLIETANFFCQPADRALFVGLVCQLREDETVTIVPTDAALLDRGFDLFTARPDKAWSLTDCTSFVVMGDSGLTDALTADRHFRQAGFVPLLIDPAA